MNEIDTELIRKYSRLPQALPPLPNGSVVQSTDWMAQNGDAPDYLMHMQSKMSLAPINFDIALRQTSCLTNELAITRRDLSNKPTAETNNRHIMVKDQTPMPDTDFSQLPPVGDTSIETIKLP